MKTTLHITSGDIAGASLAKSGVPGEVFVWHDILYDGPRRPGWPDGDILDARANYLSQSTGGGLSTEYVLKTLTSQYAKLKEISNHEKVVLWFDGCLFDQAMLCHLINCLGSLKHEAVELLCIDAFPGIEPYNGLGQLSPEQLASKYADRLPLTKEQFLFGELVDRAFSLQDQDSFKMLAEYKDAPLPWIPAAIARWLQEQPGYREGLGRLEYSALEAIRSGCETAQDIFSFVASWETPPQYWGDITLWEKINTLADRKPPLVRIEGPGARLPQWQTISDIKLFRIYPT